MKRIRKNYWYTMRLRKDLDPIDYLLIMVKHINTEKTLMFKYLGMTSDRKYMCFKVHGQRPIAKVRRERFFRMMILEKLPALEDVLYNGGRHAKP